VDGAYAGTDSDGTEKRPWPTVQQAIDAANDGGVVAVAQGKYTENVWSHGKSVGIWGRYIEISASTP